MSVAITEIMKLPCMKEAEIAAGNPENKLISSITAFMNTRNSVEQQCEAIRDLHEEGEVGAIVYYLGIIVPKLDKRVIELANNLDFVLITMPENRAELRYSDAITEIMELIVKRRLNETYFASEIIERISYLDKNQRSINSVLRIIRDRVHCSIFVIDDKLRIINSAEWPVDRGLPIGEIIQEYSKIKASNEEIVHLVINNKDFWLFKTLTINQGGLNLYLLIVKEVDDLTYDMCNQANDVLKTYLNLWTENHGKIEVEQLINAILKDEPEKMRRIAEILHIDVSRLSAMYMFYITNIEDRTLYKKELIRAEEIIKNFIKGFNNIFVTAIYENDIVIFIDRQRERIDDYLNELLMELKDNQIIATVSIFETIFTTMDARNAYVLNASYRESAELIFKRKIFKSSEVYFAKNCKNICALGEQDIINKKKILQVLINESNGSILLETLLVFMLDADMNITKTAELMYVHKNTIKYRINCLKEIFGYNINSMPQAYDLYLACALERLFQ